MTCMRPYPRARLRPYPPSRVRVLVCARGRLCVYACTQAASVGGEETAIAFSSSEGTASLSVLFGEVYLCGGQSNMQYTPRAVQFHPDGCQFDFARLSARTMHPHGAYEWWAWRNEGNPNPKNVTAL